MDLTTRTRTRTRLVLALLAVTLFAALFDAVSLWRARQADALIAGVVRGDIAIADAPGDLPELRLAQAVAQARSSAASAARDAALNRYRALQSHPRLGATARYNSANLLVRQAIEVQASSQPGQAIPLLELAKEYYRDVLRDDPAHWDARYNLERAQRLLPDPDDEEPGPVTLERNRERAVTTMRGHSSGLP